MTPIDVRTHVSEYVELLMKEHREAIDNGLSLKALKLLLSMSYLAGRIDMANGVIKNMEPSIDLNGK